MFLFCILHTDFMYLEIASHSMTTKTTSYHNSKISEQRRPKPIVCPQFRYFRALFSLLHRWIISAHLYKTNYSIVIPCCCKAKWKDTMVGITFYEQCNLCLVLRRFPIVLSNHLDMKEGTVLLDARRAVTTFKFMWLHHSVDPRFC